MQRFNVYTIIVEKVIELKGQHFKVEFKYETRCENVLQNQTISLTGRIEDFMAMLGLYHLENFPKGMNLINNPIKCKLITYKHGSYNIFLAITDMQKEKSYLIDYGIYCNKEFLKATLQYELMKDLFSGIEQVKDSKINSSNLRIQNSISEILQLQEFEI